MRHDSNDARLGRRRGKLLFQSPGSCSKMSGHVPGGPICIRYRSHYEVTAAVDAAATITPIETSGVGRLDTAAPLEFDGPGDQWSPETLLVGAIASCYVLSFRAIASASKLDWRTLTCRVTGTLDRADKGMRFVSVVLAVELTLADAGASRAAERIVHKAEENCLVTNSLSCEVELTATIAAAG